MKKILKISGIILLSLLLVLILVPFLFKDRIEQEVKNLANRKLKSEMNFTKMNVSFFSHFPNLTLTLTDFSLKASSPFEKDTLISAREISFGVNVKSLFGKTIKITRIYFDKAKVKILYNEQGAANFNVYKSEDTTKVPTDTTPSGAELNIEHIIFTNCQVIYSDKSIPILVAARGFNYSGVSRITSDIFTLSSKVRIDSLDLFYDNKQYLDSKPVKADLATNVNTKKLSVKFIRDDIKVKDIPLKFQGRFDFEKEGYLLFLHLSSVMGKEYLSATLRIHQTDTPWIYAKADARIDLSKWSKAFGLETIDIRGQYELNLKAEGPYITGSNPNVIKKNTIILSIPNFDITSKLSGGYLKYKSLPQAVSNIKFNLDASSTGNNYKNINVQLENLQASFLKNRIQGYFRIQSLKDLPLEVDLTAHCNLAELKQVFPLDSIDFSGLLDLDLKVKGNYSPEKKMFPLTTANFDLKEGFVKTKYYPHPVEKIEIHAKVINQTGTMKDVNVTVSPMTFQFEGKSFTLNSSLNNFDDLQYDIQANGIIDVGKIYQVFSQKGIALDGNIETDLSLQGKQSDATEGHYERLKNSGTLKLHNISVSSDFFPKPFIVRNGNFRFDQEKIRFDNFMANYGSSDFELKGALSNIINYLLSKGASLKGNFQLNSDFLNVDEFMAYSPADTMAPDTSLKEKGVVMIPSDLDIKFKAAIGKATFQGIPIRDFNGEMDLKNGILIIKKTGLSLIDCKVMLDATYGSITPEKAFFDFKIKAEDFDIKRAYNEIAIFRDLASSAEKAEGIVSLDYSLKGTLNGKMYPIMPSLEGGGTISLKKIKVYGLKLFNDIGKSTQKEELSNPDMSKVDIKSSIKNNIITIEQFKFKIPGLRVKIAGTTTFDGLLNMRIRIGLPPLGIFGIPLQVKGTMEDLKIKYGRGSENEEIADSIYTDELPQEMLERIKNAKEDGDEQEEPQK